MFMAKKLHKLQWQQWQQWQGLRIFNQIDVNQFRRKTLLYIVITFNDNVSTTTVLLVMQPKAAVFPSGTLGLIKGLMFLLSPVK